MFQVGDIINHDFKLHPSVRNAYHALSIDDDRKWFHPTIWDLYNEEKQKVEQVWFSGSHTDVGGGFREPGLSDIVLEWMVQKAVAHGVKLYLRSKPNWNFCIAPDSTDEWHPPRTGAGKVYPAKQRMWPVSAENTFGVPKIHASVLERAKHVEEYRPWIIEKYGNLKKNGATGSIEVDYPEDKIEPWVKEFEYHHNENEEAEMISLRDYDRKPGKRRSILSVVDRGCSIPKKTMLSSWNVANGAETDSIVIWSDGKKQHNRKR